MIRIRKAGERGHADHGWLESWHTFSFAGYRDPAYMGFSSLRVLNDDIIAPGGGFGMHPHRDMEIVTYVLEGALRHEDSLGTGALIKAGEVQRMSAGTGVRHSEFNASASERVHLLQVWLLPERPGIAPEYEQAVVPDEEKRGRWRLIASSDGREGSLTIHQDARIYAALPESESLSYRPGAGRRVYLHLARGAAALNGVEMNAGDGAFIENESVIMLSQAEDAEALLFDLA